MSSESNDTREREKKRHVKEHLLNNAVDGKMRANSNTHDKWIDSQANAIAWLMHKLSACSLLNFRLTQPSYTEKMVESERKQYTKMQSERWNFVERVNKMQLWLWMMVTKWLAVEMKSSNSNTFFHSHSIYHNFFFLHCLYVNLDWIKVMPFSTQHFFFSFLSLSPGRTELMPLHAHVILIETMLHDVTDFGLF